VKFTGNVAYSETAFLGIVEVTPPPTTPALSIDDVIVNEADGTITFTVTRTGDLSGASSVSYNTSDDSAFDSSDYTAASGTVNFASGEATQTIIVSITDDNDIEDPETFKVTLSNPTGATISDSEGVGTINSDDVAPPPGPTEGADNLTGTAGVDIITGGAGNDALNGGDGSDKAIYTGNVSSYTIVDNGGTFTITDNRSGNPDGVDTLTNVEFAEFANGTLELGTDEFAPSGSILGTSGNDTINGTSGNDVIFGFSGNDTINASTGNDIVVGGDGHDILLGSDDLDTLEGGNGLDTILGGGGDDFIEGNAGADTLTGDGSGVQGGDLFVYRAITDSPFAGTTGSSLSYDQITDFQHDMPFEFISLSRIDPDGNPINGDQAFNFVNGPPSNASVGNVQIIPIDATHFSVVVYMPGDLTPDMVINVTSPGGLDQTDLIL
jgi:Ca2+-binding RTX toxin-like protein